MKKYKLKKDLLWLEKGQIVEIYECQESPYTQIRRDGSTALQVFTPDFEMMEETEWFEEIPEKPKSVLDLEPGDSYYYIGCDIITKNIVPDTDDDHYPHFLGYVKVGNCFTTHEEAELELSKRLAIQEIKKFIHENDMEFEPDWEDEDGHQWYIAYSHTHEKFGVYVTGGFQFPNNLPFFKSEEDAQKIIDTFPQQLKLIFNIK